MQVVATLVLRIQTVDAFLKLLFRSLCSEDVFKKLSIKAINTSHLTSALSEMTES